ncbi:MAG: peptidoglycan DD-metalloendopeptidase family protein [Thermoflexales bacterium]|nr:peptidoglycan DD-metalloendopeptidase family protein [Thermoflexales bacterium]
MNTWFLNLQAHKGTFRLLVVGIALLLAVSLAYVAITIAGPAAALETAEPPMPRIPTVTPAPTVLPTPFISPTVSLAMPPATVTTTATITPTATPIPRKAYWKWPIRNSKLVRTFSAEHPAWDMGGQLGYAITAVATGTVAFADWDDNGYGYLVILDHDGGVQTWYAHLQYIVVKPKQVVYPGDQVGVMGGSGNANGWHLHFEVREGNRAVDPAWYLLDEGGKS